MSVELQAYIPVSTGEQRVVVSVAGVPLEIWSMTSAGFGTHTVTVPAARLTRDSIDLSLEIAWPTSPHEETGTGDLRKLGIGIRKLSVKEVRG